MDMGATNMVVVSNRIRVQKGMGAQMAPRFTRSKALCEFKGFHKVEVLVASLDDCDEMSVNMHWDSLVDFQVWRESDAFKAAHKRPEGGEAENNSPVISSQLVIAEVAAVLLNEA